jgi:hypothetical protein
MCAYVGPTLFIESISPDHTRSYLCLIDISQLTLCIIIFYKSLSPDFIFSAPKVTKLRTGLLRSWCSIPKTNKKYFSSAIGSQGLWDLPSLLVNWHGDSVQCVLMSWPLSKWTFIACFVHFYRHHHGCKTIALQNFIPYIYRPTFRRQKPRKSLQLTLWNL